jgi:hypothetical protein
MCRTKFRRGFVWPLATIPVGLALLVPYFSQPAKSTDGPAGSQQIASVQETGGGSSQDGIIPVCLVGFSKNLCEGRLAGGRWQTVGCPTDPCLTLVGNGARLKLAVKNNPDPCCDTSTVPCDEAPDVSGVMEAVLDFRIRLNQPCPVRGCWEGTWNIFSGSVLPIASGGIEGTLGVGTHRVPECVTPGPPARCGDRCERCYAAEFDGTFDPGRWIIHVEGSMRGRVSQGPHAGCLVCVTMQGYYVAPAGDDGLPLPPDVTAVGWTFCGTADGVLECECGL